MWLKAVSAFLVVCVVHCYDISGIHSDVHEKISDIVSQVEVHGYKGGLDRSEEFDTGKGLGGLKRRSPHRRDRRRKFDVSRDEGFDDKFGHNGFKSGGFKGDDYFGDDDFGSRKGFGRKNNFGRKDPFGRRDDKFGFKKGGFGDGDMFQGDGFRRRDSGIGSRRRGGLGDSYEDFGVDRRIDVGGRRRSPKGNKGGRHRVHNSRKMEEHQTKAEKHCDKHGRCVRRTVETVIEE